MSAKSILEYDGKALLAFWLFKSPSVANETSPATISPAPLRRTGPFAKVLTDSRASAIRVALVDCAGELPRPCEGCVGPCGDCMSVGEGWKETGREAGYVD
jgi:hypothetical protein